MSILQSYIEPGVAVVPSLTSPLGKRTIASVFGEDDWSPKRQREFEIEDFSLHTPPRSADSGTTLDLDFMSSAASSPQFSTSQEATLDIDSICDFESFGMMNMQPAADSSSSFGQTPSNPEFYLQIAEQPEEV